MTLLKSLSAIVLMCLSMVIALAQVPEHLKDAFPKGTVFHQNIAYANDTLKKHLLDIYLPANVSGNVPVVIWLHGGGWNHNDKYADMGYMKNTIRQIIEKGYALASIDYRHSTTAIFPAQILDCSAGVQFLFDNAARYHLDKNNFILMGFSAGGHLASLLALSHNNNVSAFYPAGKKGTYKIKAVLDFYGPSDLTLFFSDLLPSDTDNPIVQLLGASPLVRPDLSKTASPVTYVDAGDPAFFIVHGEKDDAVPTAQSYLLKAHLDLAKVKNELTVVKDAPHYGVMFDQPEVSKKLFAFLEPVLKAK